MAIARASHALGSHRHQQGQQQACTDHQGVGLPASLITGGGLAPAPSIRRPGAAPPFLLLPALEDDECGFFRGRRGKRIGHRGVCAPAPGEIAIRSYDPALQKYDYPLRHLPHHYDPSTTCHQNYEMRASSYIN